MSVKELLGRSVQLKIRRLAPPGALLARDEDDDRDAIPLLSAEVPAGARVGDALEVFVLHDPAGRLVATTRTPKLERGEVAFLRVTQRTPIGVFVDWGLSKELLVPFAEQTAEMNQGERYAIGLYVDHSGRLAGTMRVSEMLTTGGSWERGEWVEGEAWREQPGIGLFVILEKRLVGLLPRYEPHGLVRGDAARFRVAKVHPDGRVELSLRRHAHEEMDGDAQRILEVLRRGGGARVGDHSSPEEIRAWFGLSKKAFKRGAGRLLKEGAVSMDGDGCLRVTGGGAS